MKVTAENGAQVHAHTDMRTRTSARAHTHMMKVPAPRRRPGAEGGKWTERKSCVCSLYTHMSIFWVRICARACNRQTARRSKTIFKSLSVSVCFCLCLCLCLCLWLCLCVCVSVYVYIRHAIVYVCVCLSLSLFLSLSLSLSSSLSRYKAWHECNRSTDYSCAFVFSATGCDC